MNYPFLIPMLLLMLMGAFLLQSGGSWKATLRRAGLLLWLPLKLTVLALWIGILRIIHSLSTWLMARLPQ